MQAKRTFVVLDRDAHEVDRIPATKDAARAWISRNVLSTHVGSWRKLAPPAPRGYVYRTSYGASFTFELSR